MDVSSASVFQSSVNTGQDVLQQSIDYWKSPLLNEFKGFSGIIRKYLDRVKSSQTSNTELASIWEDLDSTIVNFIDWIGNSEKIANSYSQEDFWSLTANSFQRMHQTLPESLEIPVTLADWAAAPGDSFIVGYWKWGNRLLAGLNSFQVNLTNVIRTKLKKDPVEKPTLGNRTISVHLFNDLFVQTPFRKILIESFQKFRLRVTDISSKFHALSEEFKDRQLFSEEINLFIETESEEMQAKRIGNIEYIYQSISDLIEIFENDCDNIIHVGNEKLANVASSFEKNWNFASTKILPLSKYNAAATQAEWQKVSSLLLKSNDRWNLLTNGDFTEWKCDMELSRLQVRSIQTGLQLIRRFKQLIADEIIPALESSRSVVTDSLEKIRTLEITSRTALKSSIYKEKRRLRSEVNQDSLLLLIDKILKSELMVDFDKYRTDMQTAAQLIPEQKTILIKKDQDKLIPDPRIESIPLKELVQMYSLNELLTKHNAFSEDTEKRLKQELRDVANTEQVIDFNLETGLNLLQQVKTDENNEPARQIVVEGLERSVSQFNDLINENEALIYSSRDKLIDMTLEFVQAIQKLETNEKIFELKLKLTRAKSRKKYEDFRRRIFYALRHSFMDGYQYAKRIFQKAFLGWQRIRKLTGMEIPTERFEDEIIRLISVAYAPNDKLPYVYQRLFRIEALTSSQFYTTRDSEYATMSDEFSTWQKTPGFSTAIVGEKGSGKTTLFNIARKKLFRGYPVFEIGGNKTVCTEQELFEILQDVFKINDLKTNDSKTNTIKTMDDLEAAVIENSEQRVIIFENLHRMFVRKVNGFKALQRFLLFMTRTSGVVYWITSCSLYSWEYLDKVLHLSRYFHRIIVMEDLSPQEIENVILNRHNSSGFNLRFTLPASIAKSSKFKKLPDEDAQQTYLREIFFKDLQDIAAGNISVAMLFWIIAIEDVKKDELVLKPYLTWDHSVFQKMPQDELFTLAAIVQHDGLTWEQHAEIFYQSIPKSKSLLTRMRNNGILEETDLNFMIKPILYRPVVWALKNKNILN